MAQEVHQIFMQYDHYFTFIAYLVSMIGTLTTLLLMNQAKSGGTYKTKLFWICNASLATSACAIFSMHFIAILGTSFVTENGHILQPVFRIFETIFSLVACFVCTLIGYLFVSIQFFAQKRGDNDSPHRRIPMTPEYSPIIMQEANSNQTLLEIISKEAPSLIFRRASSTESDFEDWKSEHHNRKQKWFDFHSSKNPSLVQLIIASISIATGFALMHFLGMHGARFPGTTMHIHVVKSITTYIVALFVSFQVVWSSLYIIYEPLQVAIALVAAAQMMAVHLLGNWACIYTAIEGSIEPIVEYSLNYTQLSLMTALGNTCCCFFMMLSIYWSNKKHKNELKNLVHKITKERVKTNALLLNVLPKNIADRVYQGETHICDYYNNVSILFCDVVQFTTISESVSALAIVRMLHELFCMFDRLALKHGVEKIKTIGDCFMAAVGIPDSVDDHASKAMDFATDILEAVRYYNQHKPGVPDIRVRIGIHSGSKIVGGILGETKFTFDIWGSDVNMAARLESTGLPNCIHVSEETLKQLKREKNDKYDFQKRENIELKGLGVFTTYLLEYEAGNLDMDGYSPTTVESEDDGVSSEVASPVWQTSNIV